MNSHGAASHRGGETEVPDIFLSYNREDQAKARRFAERFEANGFSVWWDTTLRAGEAYDEVTEAALRGARAVVVLWSPKSVVSRWVRAEATLAHRNRTFMPCMIEACDRPIMFELTQTADLTHWDGAADDRLWLAFVADVARLVGKAPGTPAPVAAVPAPVAQPTESERRHLTFLSCRLADAAGIAGRLDPEEWHAIVTALQGDVMPVLAALDGQPTWRADELSAVFGYPVAHEDAAERAVRAGLGIVACVAGLGKRFAREVPAGLQVQIGIHIGMVLVTPGGDGGAEVFGEGPNIAILARARAGPGAVVLTDTVHDLAADVFEMERLADLAVEGGGEALPLYRAIGAARAGGEVPVAARFTTSFVGREDEIYLMMSRWRRVVDGDGQHLLVKGEPGIGKTRLIEEFHAAIAETPQLWINWAGGSLFTNSPFHAIVQMLSRLLEARGGEPFAALEQELLGAGMAPDALPLIAAMMGLSLPESHVPLNLAPDQRRRMLLAALAEWVFALTRRQPVVIAIEDLHWVDPSTLELVQVLIEQGATAPLMLLGTARPEFRAPWPDRGHHSQINLGRLNSQQTRALVGEAVNDMMLDADVVEAIMKRADGVPLFAEELTRLLIERGVAPGASDIPSTLLDLLAARIDRLGTAKPVAQLGAVLGREFPHDLLKAVAGLDDALLETALARLADAELIYVRGTPPRATYQFKHALVQDSAYATLPKSRRRALHLRVAQTMTEAFPALAASQPELVAVHWSRAGEVAEAIAAWHKAGGAAYARSAYKEAEAYYREGLAILADIPEDAIRDTHELKLTSALNRALQITQGYTAPETVAAANRSKALAEKSGNLSNLIREEVQVWRAIITSGDYAGATALAAHILDLNKRDGEKPVRLLFGYNAQMQCHFYTGNLMDAEAAFALLTPVIASIDHKGSAGNTIVAMGVAAMVAWVTGRAADTEARIAEGHALAAASGLAYDAALALHFEGTVRVFQRDAARARDCATRMLAISQENDFNYLVGMAHGPLGWADAQGGPATESLAAMRAALDEMARSGARVGLIINLNRLAAALLQQERMAEALATVEEALQANPQERLPRPESLEIRGRLRQATGDRDGAEADFREAMTLAREMGAIAFEIDAAYELAQLLETAGDAGAARAVLDAVLVRCGAEITAPDLEDARAMRGRLGQ